MLKSDVVTQIGGISEQTESQRMTYPGIDTKKPKNYYSKIPDFETQFINGSGEVNINKMGISYIFSKADYNSTNAAHFGYSENLQIVLFKPAISNSDFKDVINKVTNYSISSGMFDIKIQQTIKENKINPLVNPQ